MPEIRDVETGFWHGISDRNALLFVEETSLGKIFYTDRQGFIDKEALTFGTIISEVYVSKEASMHSKIRRDSRRDFVRAKSKLDEVIKRKREKYREVINDDDSEVQDERAAFGRLSLYITLKMKLEEYGESMKEHEKRIR